MSFIAQGSLVDDNLVSMDPLFEQLIDQRCTTSTEAFELCKEVCLEYGFPVKQEPNMNRNIYVYCSHVYQRSDEFDTTTSTKQSGSECQWKVVLFENENSEWVFRRSLNPAASNHSHKLPPLESQIEWPQKVQDRIIELAQQKDLTSNQIREIIKMQFTEDVTWSNRLFYNYLTEERKKIRQQETADRVQRIITATTRLTSVVAANEDWAGCVEGDLMKLLQNYKHLSGTPGNLMENMVDLQMDMIYSEIETRSRRQQSRHDDDENGPLKSKKRKASSSAAAVNNNRKSDNTKQLQKQGFHVMTIPSCTLFVRSQQLRSVSDTPIHGNSAGCGRRQALPDMVVQGQQPMPPYPQMINTASITANGTPFNVSSVFHLTSPISSTSSTSSTQQRMDYHAQMAYRNQSVSLSGGATMTAVNNNIFHSPPITDSTSMIITPSYDSTITSNGSSCGNNTLACQHQNQYSTMYPLNAYSSYATNTQPHQQTQQMHFTGSSGNAPEDIDYHFSPTNGMINSNTATSAPSYTQASQSTAAVAAAAAAAVAVHQHRKNSSNMVSTPGATDRLNGCYSSNSTSSAAAASLEYFSAISRETNVTSNTIATQRFLYPQQEYDSAMLDGHTLPLHSRPTANHSMTDLLDAAASTTANRLHHNHSFLQPPTALSHQLHPSQTWT